MIEVKKESEESASFTLMDCIMIPLAMTIILYIIASVVLFVGTMIMPDRRDCQKFPTYNSDMVLPAKYLGCKAGIWMGTKAE